MRSKHTRDLLRAARAPVVESLEARLCLDGDSIVAAVNLGDFGTKTSKSAKDAVDAADLQDIFHVHTTTPVKLKAAISKLKANANLQLLDANGDVVGSSNKSGKKDDSISKKLAAGDWYVRVNFAGTNKSASYKLKISGAKTKSVEVNAPPPKQNVEVLVNNVGLTDGQTNPVEFGSVARGASPLTQSFQVFNFGSLPLLLGQVSVPTGFDVLDGLVDALQPGQSDTLVLGASTQVATDRGGLLSIQTDDPARAPFDVPLHALVSAPALDMEPGGVLVNTQTRIDASASRPDLIGQASIPLFELDAAGVDIGKQTDLFDDGQTSHGDAVAADGIFSNSTVVTFAAVGSRFFAAGEAGNRTATVEIKGREPISDARIQEYRDRAAGLVSQATSQIQANVSDAQILDGIKQALMQQADIVNALSISVGVTSVMWETVDGALVYLNLDDLRPPSQRRGGPVDALPEGATSLTQGEGSAEASLDPAQAIGKAIVLAPYAWQFDSFPNFTDESDNIAGKLQLAGYDVTLKSNSSNNSGEVTLNDFKNLGQYDAVVITSHGDEFLTYGEMIFTDIIPQTGADYAALNADIVARRIAIPATINAPLAIRPSFIRYYGGSSNKQIVYVGACRSLRDGSMAHAFLDNGAAAYVGYNDYVASDFAFNHGIGMFDTLLRDTNNTINDIPGINVDRETDKDPAFFISLGDKAATLQRNSTMLSNYDLFIEYAWPQTQSDLDTATSFLNQTVGFATANDSTWLNWDGDNTSSGGVESVTANLFGAWQSGLWTSTATISLNAGWFASAGGTGPALLTVSLKNKTTGQTKDVVQKTITPGSQSGAAATNVGTVTVTLGTGADPLVSFVLV